jgi:hypothetical protein
MCSCVYTGFKSFDPTSTPGSADSLATKTVSFPCDAPVTSPLASPGDLPIWLGNAHTEGSIDLCEPAEIVKEQWLTDSAGSQRQYRVIWHQSVVTAGKLRKVHLKFKVLSSIGAPATHHLGQYDESWEAADEFDTVYVELVSVWRQYCGTNGITTPLPPPTPAKRKRKREVQPFVEPAPKTSRTDSRRGDRPARSTEQPQCTALSARAARAQRRSGATDT